MADSAKYTNSTLADRLAARKRGRRKEVASEDVDNKQVDAASVKDQDDAGNKSVKKS